MNRKIVMTLCVIVLGVLFIPCTRYALAETTGATKSVVNIDGQEQLAFYLDGKLYIKLRDVLELFDGDKNDLVDFNGKSKSVILKSNTGDVRLKKYIKINSLKDNESIMPLKSPHKIMINIDSVDKGKINVEVKGLQMYLLKESNYVPLSEICEIYGLSVKEEGKEISIYTDKSKKDYEKEFIFNNQTVKYKNLDLEIFKDKPSTFRVVGELRHNILELLSKNITKDVPKELLKNAPDNKSVIITLSSEGKEKIEFLIIPENKVNDKYYITYKIGKDEAQNKFLKSNISEKILESIK